MLCAAIHCFWSLVSLKACLAPQPAPRDTKFAYMRIDYNNGYYLPAGLIYLPGRFICRISYIVVIFLNQELFVTDAVVMIL